MLDLVLVPYGGVLLTLDYAAIRHFRHQTVMNVADLGIQNWRDRRVVDLKLASLNPAIGTFIPQ